MRGKPGPYTRTVAYRMVRWAVKTGKLIPQPCADCGATKVQAHHANGYRREHALDVVWVCQSHHTARHRAVEAKEIAWAQSLIDQVAARELSGAS